MDNPYQSPEEKTIEKPKKNTTEILYTDWTGRLRRTIIGTILGFVITYLIIDSIPFRSTTQLEAYEEAQWYNLCYLGGALGALSGQVVHYILTYKKLQSRSI